MGELKYLIAQNWTGVLVGIIAGFIISYIFYRLSRIRLGIAVQEKSFTVVAPAPKIGQEEVEIFFRGIKVPRVTISEVVIWNCGNTTIDRGRIVESDPFRVTLSEGSQIIEVRQKTTRSANVFTASANINKPNELHCLFDYLDPGDGARITLLHSGEKDIEVLGTFRGMPSGVRHYGSFRDFKIDKTHIFLDYFILTTYSSLILLIPASILVTLLSPWSSKIIIIDVFCAVIGIFALFIVRRFLRELRYDSPKIPKELMNREES